MTSPQPLSDAERGRNILSFQQKNQGFKASLPLGERFGEGFLKSIGWLLADLLIYQILLVAFALEIRALTSLAD